MKKILSVFLCVCLCFVMLTGCGEPKKDAAVSVKAIYDLYILGSTEGILALGMSEEDITAAQKVYDDSVKETIRSNFSASGQEIDEKALNNLCSARKEALSKMTAETEITSESEGRATVVIHTSYFSEADLDTTAFYNARTSAQQTEFSSLEEQQIFLMDTYTLNLIEAYQKVTPSKDTIDITVDCVIQDNFWVPASMAGFGSDLARAITGQK